MSQYKEIPTLKQKDVWMDFVVGLPLTRRKHDSIWVIVDRMNKLTHFILVKTLCSAEDYEVGVPLYILSDRGAQFILRFWKIFQKGLGTNFKLSTAFHPQENGQVECTIKNLKDMLRACVIYFKASWDSSPFDKIFLQQ